MKKYSILIFLAILGMIPFLTSWQSHSDHWQDKVDEELLESEKNAELDFLVLLVNQVDVSPANELSSKKEKGRFVYQKLKTAAQESQSEVQHLLNEKEVSYQSFFIVNAIRVKGNLALIEQIAHLNSVSAIVTNPRFKIEDPVGGSPKNNPPENIEWGIKKIQADLVWNMGFEGEGAVIGGQDTGYEWDNPALKEKYRGWDGVNADHNYNWHDAIHELNPLHMDTIPDPNPCGLNSLVPCDDHNHGTHTMGTMVGRVDSNFIGVAPAAKWIGCRNMDRGWGQPSTYIECFEWFLAPSDLNNENPDPDKSPDVISNSWSCPEEEGCNPSNFSVMQTAVDNLTAAGVFVVVSAGNKGGQGCNTVNAPSTIFENSFSVGASNSVDTLAWFSSKGAVTVDGSGRMKPNIVAPGVGVRSVIRNGGFGTWNGTSMAAPHVAGVVALMISADPSLKGDVARIKDILQISAAPAFDEDTCSGVPPTIFPNNSVGYGRLDALAAVQEVLGTTSVQALDQGMVKVFPNPFQNLINILSEVHTGPMEIVIYNVNGQRLFMNVWNAFPGSSFQIEMPNLSSGVYFYQIRANDLNQQGKLIKF